MPSIFGRTTLLALALATSAAGCTGIIDGGGQAAPGPEPAPEVAPVAAELCTETALIPARVRKLTDAQYQRMVGDLLPSVTPPVVATPGTELALIEDLETFVVRGPLASQYWDAAFAAAAQAVTAPTALAPCAEGRECAQQFIESFARQAFRRPLQAEDTAALLAVYDAGAETSFVRGLELVVAAALQSADFLYRTELGAPDQAGPEVTLTPFEVASLLSFTLRGRGPDAELYTAAESGALASAEGIATELTRLLGLPEVQQHVTGLFVEVLGADGARSSVRDPAAFPELDQPLRQAMDDEVRYLVNGNVFGQRPLGELFTTRESLVTDALSQFYGAGYSGPPAVGPLPADQRTGILSRGATLLSLPTGSRVVHRGLFIANRYLCRVMAPPPAGIQAEIEQTLALGLTEREISELRGSKPACAGCHANFDSLGLAFEHYDLAGKYLSERDGAPVDASGVLEQTDVDGPFGDLIELSELLARSKDVAVCLPQRVTERVLGLTLDEPEKCAVRRTIDGWADGDRQLGQLLELLPQSDFFLRRAKGN